MEPPPDRPDESDCCNSGCNPCIMDVYEQHLQKWKLNLLDKGRFANYMKPTVYRGCVLTDRKRHTLTSFLFTFRCEETYDESNLRIEYEPGQHFLLRGVDFTRAYTPIPMNDDPRSFTILCKIYEDGKMSQYLYDLEVGAVTMWRGPYGEFTLKSSFKHLLLIAQGTGIAPLYSIATAVIERGLEVFMHLFYCCSDEQEVFLRKELRELNYHWNFTHCVFLAKSVDVPEKYNEQVKCLRLNRVQIEGYLSEKPVDQVDVLICGRDSFCDDVTSCTASCGVNRDRIHVFR